jgi:hypothetical protein
MELKVGMILKRKYYDFQEVRIIDMTNEYIVIQDSGGAHFVRKKIVNDFFEILTEKN